MPKTSSIIICLIILYFTTTTLSLPSLNYDHYILPSIGHIINFIDFDQIDGQTPLYVRITLTQLAPTVPYTADELIQPICTPPPAASTMWQEMTNLRTNYIYSPTATEYTAQFVFQLIPPTILSGTALRCVPPANLGMDTKSVLIDYGYTEYTTPYTWSPTNLSLSPMMAGNTWVGYNRDFGPAVMNARFYIESSAPFIEVRVNKLQAWRPNYVFYIASLIQTGPNGHITIDPGAQITYKGFDYSMTLTDTGIASFGTCGGISCLRFSPILSPETTILFLIFQLNQLALQTANWDPNSPPRLLIGLGYEDQPKSSLSSTPIVDSLLLQPTPTPIITASYNPLRLLSVTPLPSSSRTLYPMISNQLLYQLEVRFGSSLSLFYPIMNLLSSDQALFDCRLATPVDGVSVVKNVQLTVGSYATQYNIPISLTPFIVNCYSSYAPLLPFRTTLPSKTSRISDLGADNYFHYEWMSTELGRISISSPPSEILPSINDVVIDLPTVIIQPIGYGTKKVGVTLNYRTEESFTFTYPGHFAPRTHKIRIILPQSIEVGSLSYSCLIPTASTTEPTTFTPQIGTFSCLFIKDEHQNEGICQALTTSTSSTIIHWFECTFTFPIRRSYTQPSIINGELNREDIIPTIIPPNDDDDPEFIQIEVLIEPHNIRSIYNPYISYNNVIIPDSIHERIPIINHPYIINYPHIPILTIPQQYITKWIDFHSTYVSFDIPFDLPTIASLPSTTSSESTSTSNIEYTNEYSIWNRNGYFTQDIIIYPLTIWTIILTFPSNDISTTCGSIEPIYHQDFNEFIFQLDRDDVCIATIKYNGTIPLSLPSLTSLTTETTIIKNLFSIRIDSNNNNVISGSRHINISTSISIDDILEPGIASASTQPLSSTVTLLYNNTNFGHIAFQHYFNLLPSSSSSIIIPTKSQQSSLSSSIVLHSTLSTLTYQTEWFSILSTQLFGITNNISTIEYDISFMYYPLLSTSSSTTTTNIIATQPLILWRSNILTLTTVNNKMNTNITLPVPNNITSQHVFLRIRNLSLLSLQQKSLLTLPLQSQLMNYYDDTHQFSIIGQCNKLNDLTPQGYNTFTSWSSNCSDDQQCNLQGRCINNNNDDNDDNMNPTQINICPTTCNKDGTDNTQCYVSKTSFTTIRPNCPCKKDYRGNNCNEYNQVCDMDEAICGKYGYPEKTIDGQECSKNCFCMNQNWIGNKCNICSLQCFNQGVRKQDCNSCYCTNGYIGYTCQCQSQIGQIILNGYNDVIIEYFKLINNNNINNNDEQSTTKTVPESLLIAYNNIQESLLSMSLSTLSLTSSSSSVSSSSSLQLSLVPITTTSTSSSIITNTTKFQYQFIFGCDEYNPTLTLDLLQQKWLEFTTTFITQPIINELFTFPILNDEDDDKTSLVTSEELTPNDTTIPDGYTEPNRIYHLFSLLSIISILSLTFFMFVFTQY